MPITDVHVCQLIIQPLHHCSDVLLSVQQPWIMKPMKKVGTAAVIWHELKHCNVTHIDQIAPAVYYRMEKAARNGQLERVKELYASLLADGDIGAALTDGMFKSEA